eukprot:5496378-Prymnesium_polylepis.1
MHRSSQPQGQTRRPQQLLPSRGPECRSSSRFAERWRLTARSWWSLVLDAGGDSRRVGCFALLRLLSLCPDGRQHLGPVLQGWITESRALPRSRSA